ncbi:MAG: SDR family NAD(P)-dependent oxidoreductase [Gammaproteobacteria bacterium]|nr:SDR family NAD(P)-dependent oxidoreductase [Gammaproteobacteria bacterium]
MTNLVLIIGGTSGIGFATAKYLKDLGYKVIIAGRRKIELQSEISFEVDVCDEQSITLLKEKIENQYGKINALVYSAGKTLPKKSILNFEKEQWQEMLSVNVTGLILCLKAFYPHLVDTNGRVAIISSVAARSYSRFSSFEYTASKAAIGGIVRQLSQEWAKDKILINSVFPSTTRTKMLEGVLKPEALESLASSSPLGEIADPSDTARAVEFLISRKNKYTTGSGIDVSGGAFLNA